MHWIGYEEKQNEQWTGGPVVLNVSHYEPIQVSPRSFRNVLWDRMDLNERIVISEAGKAIGLNEKGKCFRPAMVDEDTIIYSEIKGDLGFGEVFKKYRFAISWRKVYNKKYPYSGFAQFPLSPEQDFYKSKLEDFYNFSISTYHNAEKTNK